MRVILKPAGAIMVALTVSLLAILAVTQTQNQTQNRASVLPETPSPTEVSNTKTAPEETRTALVNLETVGGHDWIFWRDDKSPVRKATKRPFIGDLVIVGGQAHPYNSPLRGFSWSDGKSPEKGSDDHSGIQMGGSGNGFRFSVPASTEDSRTVRVYVGGYRAGAILSAKLSDGADPERIDTTEATGGGGHFARLYTIRFKAKRNNDKLNISWTMGGGNGDGFITLQAAAIE